MRQERDRLLPRRVQPAQIALRHSVWAEAITGKFSNRNRVGAAPEALTYLHIARSRLVMLRNGLQRTRFTNHWISQQITLSRHFSFFQKILMKTVSAIERHAHSTQMTLPARGELLVCDSGKPAHAFVAPQKQWPDGKSSEIGSLRPLPGQNPGAAFFQTVPLVHKRGLFRTDSLQETMPKMELNTSALTARIVRQLQRMESGPAPVQARQEHASSVVSGAERTLAVTEMRPRKQPVEPAERPAPVKRTEPPAPAINMAAITESVLSQLDRRLVAARERMGRI